ncbi:MAG: hypothetical protein JXR25_16825 [Pontiellaceae bacterium]|nr:hypothetical protein [Pontiellaceae bacterium]MBN2786487.1 hypothetical protein [Pontiellaceae bacterium]
MNFAYYIGVKKVVAFPATDYEAERYLGRAIAHRDDEVAVKGYVVRYSDGYESWSPAEAFERAYFCLNDPAGCKITQGDVDRMVGPVGSHRIGPKTTLVMATNTLVGFDQFATSSCVDPKNYDEAMGRTIGKSEIIRELWKCMGFVLQWAKCGLNNKGSK